MRRPVLIFLCAVLVPGLILGGLALRSIRNQEALLERERVRLLEGAASRLAQAVATRLDDHQREFSLRVESLLAREAPADLARAFDDRIRNHWPPASLGFAVSLTGSLLSPPVLGRPEARQFLVNNDDFLCRRASVEVFAVTPKGRINLADLDPPAPLLAQTNSPVRFAQLIGDAQEGVLARFVDDHLVVWVWYRTPRQPDLVFGAQLALPHLQQDLADLVRASPSPVPGVALALLDERGRVVGSTPGPAPGPPAGADWLHPLASAAIGPSLPNWRLAAAVFDPPAPGRTPAGSR